MPPHLPQSQHPADQLIRELVRTRRPATPAEVQQILARLATAPFNSRAIRVPVKHRGLAYLGRPLGPREASLRYHLAKRVLVEEQWALGTTEQDYVDDLRAAVYDAAARLLIYHRQDGDVAAVLVPNRLPAARLGPQAQPLLFVVYSADLGCTISGYQASSVATINLPGDIQWLK